MYFLASCNLDTRKAPEITSLDTDIRLLEKRNVLELSLIESHSLINLDIRDFVLLGSNEILVFDRMCECLMRIELLGMTMDTIVQNGLGPSECKLPVGFEMYEDTYVFVDRDQMAFKALDPDKDSLLYFKFGRSFSNAVVHGISDFTIASDAPEFALEVVNYTYIDSSWQDNWLTPIQLAKRGSSISHDGFFAYNDCNQLIYAPYLIPEVYIWDDPKSHSGSRSLQLIYSFALPEVHIDDGMAMATSSTVHLIDIEATCNAVYVLNFISDNGDYLYVDAYLLDSGAYFGSFRLDILDEIDKPRKIRIDRAQNLMYVLYENSLKVYVSSQARL